MNSRCMSGTDLWVVLGEKKIPTLASWFYSDHSRATFHFHLTAHWLTEVSHSALNKLQGDLSLRSQSPEKILRMND